MPVPTPEELIGRWDIKMDGWRKILFKNVKVIEEYCTISAQGICIAETVKGHNIAFWFINWGKRGRFDVKEDGALYYHNRRIVDWLVKRLDGTDKPSKDRLKGLYIKDGKPRCTFTMERIDASQD